MKDLTIEFKISQEGEELKNSNERKIVEEFFMILIKVYSLTINLSPRRSKSIRHSFNSVSMRRNVHDRHPWDLP